MLSIVVHVHVSDDFDLVIVKGSRVTKPYVHPLLSKVNMHEDIS